jgi:hypothetical protein
MRYTSVVLVGLLALCSGCTYYQAAPGTYTAIPSSKFDRAWSASINAFQDQGVTVLRQDREAGILEGSREGITVTATLTAQADGGVQVRFDTFRGIRNMPWTFEPAGAPAMSTYVV